MRSAPGVSLIESDRRRQHVARAAEFIAQGAARAEMLGEFRPGAPVTQCLEALPGCERDKMPRGFLIADQLRCAELAKSGSGPLQELGPAPDELLLASLGRDPGSRCVDGVGLDHFSARWARRRASPTRSTNRRSCERAGSRAARAARTTGGPTARRSCSTRSPRVPALCPGPRTALSDLPPAGTRRFAG